MNERLKEVGQRIAGLREILGIPVAELASITSLTEEEYLQFEAGNRDFTFTFLYNLSERFGVDMTEIMTGRSLPKLSTFSVIRAGEGLPIARRNGFQYQHLAYLFKNRIAEPFRVCAKYSEEEEKTPIELHSHEGQEMDYILDGVLRVRLENHEFKLYPGDAVYYDSGHAHGMTAAEGKDCVFLAFVMKYANKENEED